MPAFAFDLFAHRNTVKRAVSGACHLYKSPKTGASLNSSTPITFEWDPSCLGDAKYIDIALLSARGEIFRWGSVTASNGKHDCQLDASWWDQQNSVQLQLGITATDEPLALSPFPAGPVFTARNSNPIPTVSTPSSSVSGSRTSSTPAPTGNYAGAGGMVNVQRLYSAQQSQYRGRLAASIILPLLVAVLLFVGGYIWYSRRREAKRRQQWVETVDKRMSRVSADWQSMSALGGGARPSMQSGRSRTMSHLGGPVGEHSRPSIYERFKSSNSEVDNEKNVFAAEDLTQLGPRARALSAAAAEGRPLSELYKDLPTAPSPSATGVTRVRSKSMAHEGTSAGFLSRPVYNRAPGSHARTTSTTSNNPYASAMMQRDSQILDDKALYAFPASSPGVNGYASSSPVQRSRLDSSNSGPTPRTRLDSANGRGRVTSRVSFADVPRPNERKWNQASDAEKLPGLRSSVTDSFAVDFDSLPALALMRVQSGEGLDGVESKSPFTPTREFIPGSKEDYLSARQATGTGISGRTPDEMLKAYAAAMAGEKGEFGQEMEMGAARGQGRQQRKDEEEQTAGIFSSVRKLWRK